MNSRFLPTHLYKVVFYGITATFFLSVTSTGWYHPDEHYQIMEYANVFLTDNSSPSHLPWEYQKEMRGGILPLAVYTVGKCLRMLNMYNPFLLAMFMRMLAASLSVAAVLILWKGVRETLGGAKWDRFYMLTAFFFWITAYHHVRFSSENISGALLTIAVGLYMIYTKDGRENKIKEAFVLGCVGGCAFIVRYQTGVSLLFMLLFMVFVKKMYRTSVVVMAAGCFMMAAGLAADRWLYGHWTFTPYNYVYENMVEGHADYFGTYGMLTYLHEILREGMYVFSAVVLAGWMYYVWKNPVSIISWVSVPFVLLHFIIPHKEPRFLFPLLGFVPYVMTYAAKNISTGKIHSACLSRTWKSLIMVNFMALAYISVKGDTVIRYYGTLYAMCHDENCNVSIINASHDSFAYHYHEDILYPREVDCHYYMAEGVKRIHAHSCEEVAENAKNECSAGKTVFVLSNEQNLSLNLPFKKILFSPYPGWITKYFNINDWVSRSSATNEYIYVLKNHTKNE